MMGPQNVLHKYEPLLLNTPICMLLYLLACVIVTASSAVIYMYGYQKFMAFIQQEKEKQTIQLAEVSCHQAVTKQSPNCNLGQDLGVDVLPPHRRHVHPHRPRCVQRAPALRLHHHLQGLAQYLALDKTSRWFSLNFLSTCNFSSFPGLTGRHGPGVRHRDCPPSLPLDRHLALPHCQDDMEIQTQVRSIN